VQNAPAPREDDGVGLDAHVGAAVQADGETANDAHKGAPDEIKVERVDDAHVGVRAKQNVSPATRRTVLRRDNHRCTVPGCRSGRYVDLHHVELSSEGGGNRASNLVTLCGAHHRAAHRGELLISGSVPEGVSFRHADGSVYGQPLDPRVADVRAKAFGALRNLGFREGETRTVLTNLCKEYGGRLPSLGRILRDALARLSSAPRTASKTARRART
jgi:hypothetical protein